MQLSIHYYVLSLSEQTCRLYEGFRDTLIDIQNSSFPFDSSMDMRLPMESAVKDNHLREFYRMIDLHFTHYYEQDPLRLVVVGDKKNQSVFASLTAHLSAIIGRVMGEYTSTSPHDLGKIVWPLVKEVLAGSNAKVMADLDLATSMHKVTSGLDAVAKMADSATGATLLVEEDYHIKGSISKTDQSLVISEYVDIREVIDDAVDVIVEKVLEMGGNVIFLESGLLTKLSRIALIQRP
jgi:hypothetical protein